MISELAPHLVVDDKVAGAASTAANTAARGGVLGVVVVLPPQTAALQSCTRPDRMSAPHSLA